MGAESAVSAAVSVGHASGTDRPGARHRLPRHRWPPDPAGRLYATVGSHGRSYPHPEVRLGAESEHPLPHAVPRRGL